MEKQFFLSFIDLINEVQGIQKLPSQLNFNRKSSWMKQVSNPRQKSQHKHSMLIKTVFDIQTQEKGYAICDPATQQCGFVTYSITNAIKAGQCKSIDEVQQLINT